MQTMNKIYYMKNKFLIFKRHWKLQERRDKSLIKQAYLGGVA